MSSEAWIALGCLVGIVGLSGLVLWAAWRRGKKAGRSARAPENQEGPSFTRSWQREDDQFAELARQVDALRAQEKDRPKENHPQG